MGILILVTCSTKLFRLPHCSVREEGRVQITSTEATPLITKVASLPTEEASQPAMRTVVMSRGREADRS